MDFAITSHDPYESHLPMNRQPTLEQVVAKAVDISKAWRHSREEADFIKHLSSGPLQLSGIGVRKFGDLVAEGDLSTEEVREGVLELMIDDMLISSERSGLADKWREEMDAAALRDGRFTFDKEVVRDLLLDENPIEVEDRAGEGWTERHWAEKFVGQGFDVSGIPMEKRIREEADRLMGEELNHRNEIERAYQEADRMEKVELSRITYVGDEVANQDERWRKMYYLPGEEVALNTNLKVQGLDMGELEEKFRDNALKVSETIVTRVDDFSVRADYRFEGYKGSYPAVAFDHPNGVSHEFGIMTTRDDKMWFVALDDLDGKPKGPAREVVGLEGRAAPDFVPQGFAEFRKELASEPSSGEFVVIPTERDDKAAPVQIAGIPWMSGVSEREREVANKAIDEAIASRGARQGEAEVSAAPQWSEAAAHQAKMIMARLRGHGLLSGGDERQDEFEATKLTPLLASLDQMREQGGGWSPVLHGAGAKILTEADLERARKAAYPDLRPAYENDDHLVATVAHGLADRTNLDLVSDAEARKMVYPDLRKAYSNDEELVGRVQEAINADRAAELVMTRLRFANLVGLQDEAQNRFKEDVLRPMLDPSVKPLVRQAEVLKESEAAPRARKEGREAMAALGKGPSDRELPPVLNRSLER